MHLRRFSLLVLSAGLAMAAVAGTSVVYAASRDAATHQSSASALQDCPPVSVAPAAPPVQEASPPAAPALAPSGRARGAASRAALPATGNAGILPGTAPAVSAVQEPCATATVAPPPAPTVERAPTATPTAMPDFNLPGGGGGGGGIGGDVPIAPGTGY
jgi:hypothetical protein